MACVVVGQWSFVRCFAFASCICLCYFGGGFGLISFLGTELGFWGNLRKRLGFRIVTLRSFGIFYSGGVDGVLLDGCLG